MPTSKKGEKRERILDVAEELFALHGYDGVTMRQVSSGAKVDVALANYHFGKKLDLFHAVF
ncbi:MAG: AcrR family transcriptional regulator, partial [Halioglobus sp.]